MSIEFIAQEFWDYVNESETPIALKMMESGYLFVQVADSTAIEASVEVTSTVGVAGSISTNYTILNSYLTDATITNLTPSQVSTFMRSWNAPVDVGGHIIGASLFSGSVVGLQDAASYPGDYAGSFTVMLQPLDGGAGARGLTFSAGTIDWTNDLVLSLVDGTEFDFQVNESGEIEPARVPSIVESDASDLYDSIAFEVATPTPNDWGFTVDTDFSYPAYVFPAAFMYWDREITWMRNRLETIKTYVEHTIGTQVVALDVADNFGNPKIYVNYTTDIVYLRLPEANDLGLINGTVLPFTSYTVLLGSITIPRELSEERYNFENEQLYAYKNVTSAVRYDLNVRGRCTVNTPNTVTFVPGDAGIPAYNAYAGVYASATALLTALDTAIPGGAPHTVHTDVDTTDWWKKIKDNSGGIFGTKGYIYKNVTAAISAVYSLDKVSVSVDQCQVTPYAIITPTNHYIYNSATGEYTIDEDWPGIDPITNISCSVVASNPTFCGIPISTPYTNTTFGGVTLPTIEIDGETFTPENTDIPVDFPSATFNLQNGVPAPVYPTYQGAFVYDLELKKWGKMKMSFLSLLDFAPVNTQSSQLLPNARYGVAGGILDADGAIYQWDANPTDAYIKYGKFSLFRLGITTIQEIEAQFGIQSTGSLETETSLDGKTVDLSLSTSYDFEGARVVKAPISKAGVWHNIILRGQFDLTYLQVNAYRSGRR